MKNIALSALLACSVVGLSGTAQAKIITFDDISTSSYAIIPNGYEGFDWKNFAAVISSYGTTVSGYKNGTVSPSNVGFNLNGTPASFSSSSTFTLSSLYVTAAWNDGLSLTLNGSVGGVVVDSNTFVINTESPTFLTLNYKNIDTFSIVSSGGVNQGYGGQGTQVAFDNIGINLSAVPLPASAPLFGAALMAFGAVGYGMKRKGKAAA